MDLSTITPAAFKAQFPREFPYATVNSQDASKYVLDSDIQNAFLQARMQFNQSIIPTPAGLDPAQAITLAFLYLAAFYLVIDIKNALGGVEGTGATFPVNSRSVGNVSVSYTIPEKYLKNPNILYLTQNGFGQKYLSFILPGLIGNAVAVFADTNP